MGPPDEPLAVHEILMIIEATSEVIACLRAQACHQPSMSVALIRPIQTEFNESLGKVFISTIPVRWPQLTMLMRTLATGNFRPESVVMTREFHGIGRQPIERLGKKLRENHQESGGGGGRASQKTPKTAWQKAVHDPAPIQSLHVGTGFKLRLVMDMAKDMTITAVPLTDASRPF